MDADRNGIVYLVGAGPGDAGLITVRGVERLRVADVVVYDNLANPDLLRYARADAELIYAGKMADQHTKSQDEINGILSDRASRGLRVVRLKGGDPFLFGRGGEEAGWLVEQGIAWEVVPGISSAIAAPAYAGIPVTHRIMNGSLHVVTGHESIEGVGPDVDWSVLAKSKGTIVVLMGVKNLPMITEKLMAHGLAAETPAAMVRWATLAEQRTLVSRLDRIADDVARAVLKPPAVCVIGDVVKLRESLVWVERRPLFGLRIAVTRPTDENDVLAAELDGLGAEVAHTSTLKVVRRVDSHDDVFEELRLGGFDWIVLTSGNGARFFADALAEQGTDARLLAGCRLAAIGARTADAMRARGLAADLVVENARQESLAAELLTRKPKSVLIPRAARARPHLENALNAAGASTRVMALYDTVPDELGIGRLRDLLEREKVDIVTFTSARTFEALVDAADGRFLDLLGRCRVAVIGPVTRAAVEAAGVVVACESPTADMKVFAREVAGLARD